MILETFVPNCTTSLRKCISFDSRFVNIGIFVSFCWLYAKEEDGNPKVNSVDIMIVWGFLVVTRMLLVYIMVNFE